MTSLQDAVTWQDYQQAEKPQHSEPPEKSPLLNTQSKRSCQWTAVIATIALLCLALMIGLILGLVAFTDEVEHSATGHYARAAVASDSVCSKIGSDVLSDGGSVVDAAIATVLCSGLHNAHSTGVGGGDIMIIYETPRNGTEREMVVLDSREVAPLASTPHMLIDPLHTALNRALLTGVPGQLPGMYEAWKRFGRLPWKRLLNPTIAMCEEGIAVSEVLANNMKWAEFAITPDSGLQDILMHADGTLLEEGDIMRRPKLAETLRAVANQGPAVLYTGSLAESFLQDIHDHGGIITAEDLRKYKPVWREATVAPLWGSTVTMAGVPPPFGGNIVQFILQLMARYRYNATMPESLDNEALFYHRLLESIKFGKSLQTYLGDPAFSDVSQVTANLTSSSFQDQIFHLIDDDRTHNVSYYQPFTTLSKDSGTSHTSIIGPGGSAVGITSTVNTLFGATARGKRTGIILNNEMLDFIWQVPLGQPAVGPNTIEPGKRPGSSMSPTLLLDEDGNVIMVIGGSGGTKIPSVVSQVMTSSLMLGVPISDAIDQPQVHTDVINDGEVKVELQLSQDIVSRLRGRGHTVSLVTPGSLTIIQAVTSECHKDQHDKYCLTAVSDWRKGGLPDGF